MSTAEGTVATSRVRTSWPLRSCSQWRSAWRSGAPPWRRPHRPSSPIRAASVDSASSTPPGPRSPRATSPTLRSPRTSRPAVAAGPATRRRRCSATCRGAASPSPPGPARHSPFPRPTRTPAHPRPLNTSPLPLVSVTAGDETLGLLQADFPNTAPAGDPYEGLYQLRVKTSGPGQSAGGNYYSADIKIVGTTWSVVYSNLPTTTTTTTTPPTTTSTTTTVPPPRPAPPRRRRPARRRRARRAPPLRRRPRTSTTAPPSTTTSTSTTTTTPTPPRRAHTTTTRRPRPRPRHRPPPRRRRDHDDHQHHDHATDHDHVTDHHDDHHDQHDHDDHRTAHDHDDHRPPTTTTTTRPRPRHRPPRPDHGHPDVGARRWVLALNSKGWAPGEKDRRRIHSTPVALGQLTVDDTGSIAGSFVVPADIDPGAHTISLSGKAASGEVVTVSARSR